MLGLVGLLLFISISYGLYELFSRVEEVFTRTNTVIRSLYLMLVSFLSTLLCTILYGLIFYYSDKSFSRMPVSEAAGTMLDIALGYTFMTVIIFLAVPIIGLLYCISEKLIKRKPYAAKFIRGTTGILIIGAAFYYAYNLYLSTNSPSDLFNGCAESRVWMKYEEMLFGKSVPSFYFENFSFPDFGPWKNLSCDAMAPFSTIDLNNFPIRISQAQIHISGVLTAWGFNALTANLATVSLQIIALVADILGIVAFTESRRKRNKTQHR